MAFFANCGAAVTDGAAFCAGCGKPVGLASQPVSFWLILAVALALVATPGCSSAPKSGDTESPTSAQSNAHIDVMCIGDRISTPPESFHYFYKYVDASGSVEKEADITPQTMDVTIKDGSGSHSYHGVHSDEASWNSAVLDLSSLNITKMSAMLDSLNDSSAVTRESSETVNGYQTTKYAIDTTSSKSSDKKKFETLFGKGSFEKGTLWVPADGCAVKLVLDEGLWQSDGSVKNAHYEMERVKK